MINKITGEGIDDTLGDSGNKVITPEIGMLLNSIPTNVGKILDDSETIIKDEEINIIIHTVILKNWGDIHNKCRELIKQKVEIIFPILEVSSNTSLGEAKILVKNILEKEKGEIPEYFHLTQRNSFMTNIDNINSVDNLVKKFNDSQIENRKKVFFEEYHRIRRILLNK